MQGNDPGGAIRDKTLIDGFHRLHTRDGGGGKHLETGQLFIELLAGEVHPIAVGLAVHVDEDGDNGDGVADDLVSWEITGTVGNNANGLGTCLSVS